MWKSLVLLLLLSSSLCRGQDSATQAKTKAKFPRRLATSGQRFINEFEYNAWYWPPKRPKLGGKQQNNLDYKYNQDGDTQWFEDFEEAVKQYEEIRKDVEDLEDDVEKFEKKNNRKVYRTTARIYPICVDGFKPLLHETEDPEIWSKSQHEMANPKYNYVMDEFYHWMPIFQILNPRDGVYNLGDDVNLMDPPTVKGKIIHRVSETEGSGPFVVHCKRHYLQAPDADTVDIQKNDPTADSLEGTSWVPDRNTEQYQYLPQWFHIECQAFKNFRLEGFYIQAISYPNGLPFGKFVDTHDCHTNDIHVFDENGKSVRNYPPDVTCYKNESTFDWIEGTPAQHKKIRNIVPCKYNHGNNNGGYYPTVWVFGGNRWTIPKPKFGTFRTLFTYTSAHCNHVMRMNFLVIGVRSFINAVFDVYISASVPVQPHDTSFTTPHLLDSWKGKYGDEDRNRRGQYLLDCSDIIMQPDTPETRDTRKTLGFLQSEFWEGPRWAWLEDHNEGTFKAKLQNAQKAFTSIFVYDREYDDCIRDSTNSLGLLDGQKNCPPSNLCLNLEHPDQVWDQREADGIVRGEGFKESYNNPVSIIRFDKFWIWINQHSKALDKLTDDKCYLKRCLHPKFTIPIVKIYEWPEPFNKFCSHDHFAIDANRGRRRRRSLQPRQGQVEGVVDQDGLNDDKADPSQGDGVNPFAPHRFSEELTRGVFILYNNHVKKSIITHAWMMVFAWFILLTVGIFTSRYYKETGGTNPDGGNSLMGIGAWIWVHAILLLVSMCLMWMGVLEVAHYRQRPNSCNMFETFQDLSLKNYCRWRKQSVRYHQALGYVSLVLFHLAFFLSWSRPVKELNVLGKFNINWRKIFVWVHVFSGYGGKIFAVASVMAFWDARAFSICKDIPILIIVIEFVSILFFVVGWVVQNLEDRRRPHDEDNKWVKSCCPVLEAVSAEDVPWYGCKVAVVVSSVVVHLALFMIVCVSLDMVFGKDGEGAENQGDFEIRKGLFGTCNVTSRDSIMRGMISRYFQQQTTD